MSLDVYLNGKTKQQRPASSGIFIREDGKTIEVTEEEWKRRHPDREPVRYQHHDDTTNVLYHDNITHNLTKMADRAGIYEALWRPEDRGWNQAKDIIKPLELGLKDLQSDPDFYKKENPTNGWGTYEALVAFVTNYLAACKEHPTARIEVSR